MPFISAAVYLMLPPAGLAWMALGALLLPRRFRPRLVAGILLGALVLLSVPAVSRLLLLSLEVPAAAAEDGRAPGAIVILSAEIERAGERGAPEVGALTLERERAGAALHRATGLPILVTGGVLGSTPPPIAALMARSLLADFGVPIAWTEIRSATTWENAQFSAPMLKAAGVGRVFLVTHGWHMRRSVLAFHRAGIEAVPAPVRLAAPLEPLGLDDLLPSMGAWTRSYWAVHEWIGLLFYGLRR